MDAGMSCPGRSLCWLPTYPPEYMHVYVHGARVHVCAHVHACMCVYTLQISEPAHSLPC